MALWIMHPTYGWVYCFFVQNVKSFEATILAMIYFYFFGEKIIKKHDFLLRLQDLKWLLL
jgi:hypothetical protein